MNFILNEEQQMLADTVARFVQTEYDFEARPKRLFGQGHRLARLRVYARFDLALHIIIKTVG